MLSDFAPDEPPDPSEELARFEEDRENDETYSNEDYCPNRYPHPIDAEEA